MLEWLIFIFLLVWQWIQGVIVKVSLTNIIAIFALWLAYLAYTKTMKEKYAGWIDLLLLLSARHSHNNYYDGAQIIRFNINTATSDITLQSTISNTIGGIICKSRCWCNRH